jgi:LAO/AO transport system kinase
MTDLFVLMQLPNAGDDLQAIKRGVMERADLVLINKADIDADAATRAQAQITSALRLLGLGERGQGSATAHWQPQVLQLSALKGAGIEEFWQAVTNFRDQQGANGQRERRRHEQDQAWMRERIEAGLRQRFKTHPAVQAALGGITQDVLAGRVAASVAARRLLDLMD